jgi:hypothetical protein
METVRALRRSVLPNIFPPARPSCRQVGPTMLPASHAVTMTVRSNRTASYAHDTDIPGSK